MAAIFIAMLKRFAGMRKLNVLMPIMRVRRVRHRAGLR